MFSLGVVISINDNPIATTRLIFNTDFSLPALTYSGSTKLSQFLNIHPKTSEISRFLILKNFRNSNNINLGDFNYSSILLSLYLSIYILIDSYSLNNVIFLCEKN